MMWVWEIDGWIILTAVLCALSATLLGNFLVLRRMSMMGDALSHAVLPGLVAGFLLTGSRDGWVMFVGAAITGVLTAFLTDWINRLGKVDEGASMGVVFSALFALGLVMINQIPHVDLDANCVLYGNINLSYLNQTSLWFLGMPNVSVPRSVVNLSIVLIANIFFIILFFKELRIACFDPALAETMGMKPKTLHYTMMAMVAITVVACFESVGNILVVAMLIVPASAAFICSRQLSTMISVSLVFAAVSAVFGHLISIWGPWGDAETSTAGMMALCSGILFTLAILFSPTEGVVQKWRRRNKLASSIIEEDVLAFLYRYDELADQQETPNQQTASNSATIDQIQEKLLVSAAALKRTIRRLDQQGLLTQEGDTATLTTAGRKQGKDIVRSHRLWEQYLAQRANVQGEKIHANAEKLEHFTGPALRALLDQETDFASIDPHGRPIPPESPNQENDAELQN